MDTPCFWYSGSTSNCLREEGENCIRGVSWDLCIYGKGGQREYGTGDSHHQTELTKAREIRQDITAYLNTTCWAIDAYPEIKGVLTKIILKHLRNTD